MKENGIVYNILRNADDTVIFTESETDLQDLVSKLHSKSKEHGMEINLMKTKTMVTSKKSNI